VVLGSSARRVADERRVAVTWSDLAGLANFQPERSIPRA
jgi:hypothetical protein